MYTQEDVRKLFMQRGEIEMELKVRQAQYYGREAEIPSEMAARVMALQRELMELIGALFCVVNPIPVKKALELEGIPVGDPRLPLTAFPVEKLPLLKAALAKTPDA